MSYQTEKIMMTTEVPTEVRQQIEEARATMAKQARHHPEETTAQAWWDFEESDDFANVILGCPDHVNRKATIFAIEAVRCMTLGVLGADTSLQLLRLAVKEMEAVTCSPEHKYTKRMLQHAGMM
jgi:hypothetical protein